MNAQDVRVVRAASDQKSYPSGIVSGLPQLDGVTLINGELVFLKDQNASDITSGYYNGIYTYAQSGPSLTLDTADYPDITYLAGLNVVVTEGTTNSDTQWQIDLDIDSGGVKHTYTAKVPGFATNVVPVGLMFNNMDAPNQKAIQNSIDNLIKYDNSSDQKSYWHTIDLPAGTRTLLAADIGTLFRCKPASSGTTIIHISAGPSYSCGIYVALFAPGLVQFQKTSGVTVTVDLNGAITLAAAQLTARFQGAKLIWIWDSGSGSGAWTLSDAPVVAGGTVFLPGGNIYVNGNGIKLHPSVSLTGENVASTVLAAGNSLAGTSDSGQDSALLTVCAREPKPGASGTQMFNPVIQNLTIQGTASATIIYGIDFEKGGVDPYDRADTGEYKGSSGQIYNCVVQGFTGWGVHCAPDRQRFYCEGLRCIGNGSTVGGQLTGIGGGIYLQGNDPVIGPRSGFGSNTGTSIWAKDCSGLIIVGANVWESLLRGAYGMACQITNMNGAVIADSKFNDTISIEIATKSNK